MRPDFCGSFVIEFDGDVLRQAETNVVTSVMSYSGVRHFINDFYPPLIQAFP